MNLKTKDMQFEVKAVQDDGFFSGYCNVFDVVDSYGDIVRKGAFVESINAWQAKGKMPPILWQHDRGEVIGVWTKLYEDDHGLYGEGKLLVNDVAKAQEAHALLKHQAIDGLSIGYYTQKWAFDEQTGNTDLLQLDLREVSVVTFPANIDSRIDTVKSTLEKGELPTLAEFEKFLRDAGFSKSQTTAIAGHGLRQLLGEPVVKETAADQDAKRALEILKNLNI